MDHNNCLVPSGMGSIQKASPSFEAAENNDKEKKGGPDSSSSWWRGRGVSLLRGAGVMAVAVVALYAVTKLGVGASPTAGPTIREKNVEWLLGSDVLTVNEEDSRPKLLYLGVSQGADHNGFTSPLLNSPILAQLGSAYDLQYTEISRPGQICESIERAVGKGGVPLSGLWIKAHGTSNWIDLHHYSEPFFSDDLKGLPKDCFHGLHPEATIVLDSCNTGEADDGFAAQLSCVSERTVVASSKTMTISAVSLPLESLYRDTGPKPVFLSPSIFNWHTMERIFHPDGRIENGRVAFASIPWVVNSAGMMLSTMKIFAKACILRGLPPSTIMW